MGANANDNSKVDVRFLKQYGAGMVGNTFIWPDKHDISPIDTAHIIGYVIDALKTLRRGELKFDVDANEWKLI